MIVSIQYIQGVSISSDIFWETVIDKKSKFFKILPFFQDSSDDECGIPKPPRDLPGRPKSAAVTRRLDFPRQENNRCWIFRGKNISIFVDKTLLASWLLPCSFNMDRLKEVERQRQQTAQTFDQEVFFSLSSTRSCFCQSFVINQWKFWTKNIRVHKNFL